MAKYVKIGSLISHTREDGSKNISIGLGTKSAKPEYANTVEIIVRDGNGKVVSRQIDGYINLTDPREEPASLLKAGIIDAARAEKMQEDVKKLSDKVRYVLKVATTV